VHIALTQSSREGVMTGATMWIALVGFLNSIVNRQRGANMRTLLSATAALLLAFMSVAQATTYLVTFENTIIDNNPNYTVTGSFLYNSAQVTNPSSLYGLSNFDVSVVSQYGTLQMNTVWSVDSAFDYIGFGTSNSPDTPALVLIFSLTSNGNGTGLNALDQAATNGVPLSILPLESNSNSIPGGSALVPSIGGLYGAYDNYLFHNGLPPSAVFSSVSGSLAASPVPGPVVGAGLPGVLMAVAGFIGWRRSRRATTVRKLSRPLARGKLSGRCSQITQRILIRRGLDTMQLRADDEASIVRDRGNLNRSVIVSLHSTRFE